MGFGAFVKNRLKAFRYAWKGLVLFFKQENSAKIHATLAIGSLILCYLLKVNKTEWLIIILTIGLVLCVEILNTAIEEIVDYIQPDFHPIAGKIKDFAAAAVFFSAIISTIVGGIIFLPKIFYLLFY